MGILAFYPWLPLKKDYSFGDYHLLPYKRGQKPAGKDHPVQDAIDRITKAYLLSAGQPIVEATLLQVGDGSLVRDLNEAERQGIFEFCELLAVSGLSGREFFTWGYWNRDNFRVVVQGFTDHEFVSYNSRRKDGSSTQAWSVDKYQVLKPDHVDVKWSPTIDEDLLNSLLRARTLPPWEDLWGAILYYNLSNTDNIEIDWRVEFVLAVGALESLLSTRGDGKELADEFEKSLKPDADFPIADCTMLSAVSKFPKSNTVRHVWVRDFYNLRSKLAHGELGHKYPAIWSDRNHLLLHSYVFPLVLKCLLAANGIYQFTNDDRFRINAFERLACQDHFGAVVNSSVPNEHPWNKIIHDEIWEDARRRAVETLRKMRAKECDEEEPKA